jgi:glyoxylase-like metal-dependent hydrolase (beta-lactamase superfamily II)
MSHRVTAVRYATRVAHKSELYYRWSSYGVPDAEQRMDYFFWLLQDGDETVVVDSGFDPAEGRARNRECTCEPADALARLGVDPAAVKTVLLTHLHWDHTGNLDLFPNAELVVTSRELDFWTSAVASRHHFAELVVPRELDVIVRAEKEGRVRRVESDGELVPGVHGVIAGGHSPAQLVLRVDTAGGSVVLAGDVIHYYEELELDRPFDVLVDLADCYRAFDVLRDQTANGERLVAGHDPEVMNRFDRVDDLAVVLS